MLPDCNDPVFQAEIRERLWDEFADTLPVCTLCWRRLYPGDKFHATSHQIVCAHCLEELTENEDVVEVA